MPIFSLTILLISIVLNVSSQFVFEPQRFTRSQVYRNEDVVNSERPMEWTHARTISVGDIPAKDVKAILESLNTMTHPESPKFPRIKVYSYDFEGGPREILVYTDPDEGQQWVVNIEDIDLRQTLIIFRLGDLGFGFSKEGTYVVLRKSSLKLDTFHYMHLAYIQPNGMKGGLRRVEWDNIQPKDLYPIPIRINEPLEDYAKPNARTCGFKEWIFGTCAVVKLNRSDIGNLSLKVQDRERINALIHEKQPFLLELADIIRLNNETKSSNSTSKAQGGSAGNVRNKREISLRDQAAASNVGRVLSGKQISSRDTAHTPPQQQFELLKDASEDDDSYMDMGNMKYKAVEKRYLHTHDSDELMSVLTRDENHDDKLQPARALDDTEPDLSPLPSDSENQTEKKKASGDMGKNHTGNMTNAGKSDTPKMPQFKDETNSFVPTTTEPTVQATVSKDEGRKRTEIKPTKNSSTTVQAKNKTAPSTLELLLASTKTGTDYASIPRDQQNQSYYIHALQKVYSDPPAKYTFRPLECIGCETMGTFLSEYDEDCRVSTVVVKLLEGIFKKLAKEKDQGLFSPEAHEMLQEHFFVPFVGYGNCDYSVAVLGGLPKSSELDDIIDYYGETLAVNCEKKDCESQRPRTRLRELLTSRHHLLEISSDNTIRFNKTSKLPTHAILSPNEFRHFMVSLIFSAYATEYRAALRNHGETDLPNPNQSYRMKFLTKVILRTLNELLRNYPQHLIKGTRYLLQILEDKFLSLVVERLGINQFNFRGQEKERAVYKAVNGNDRLQVLALKEFIINGISPISRSGTDSAAAFTSFFGRNQRRIVSLLLIYGMDVDFKEGKHSSKKDIEDKVSEFIKKSMPMQRQADEDGNYDNDQLVPVTGIQTELEEVQSMKSGVRGLRDTAESDPGVSDMEILE